MTTKTEVKRTMVKLPKSLPYARQISIVENLANQISGNVQYNYKSNSITIILQYADIENKSMKEIIEHIHIPGMYDNIHWFLDGFKFRKQIIDKDVVKLNIKEK